MSGNNGVTREAEAMRVERGRRINLAGKLGGREQEAQSQVMEGGLKALDLESGAR